MPAGGDGRRGPAVHPLHLGLDRKAEGRAAHFRRLSRVRLDDASIRVRLPRRRHLLVHRRCRLGYRPLLYRLRSARQRRHHADVRGRAELSRPLALLAGGRQAQGQDLLHRADRDQGADGRRRRVCEEEQAGNRSSCSAASASRSIRKRGSGITTWSARSAARSSILGGRPKPAASSSRRCPARPSSSPAPRRCRSSACSRRWSTARAISLEGEATGNLVILDAWPGHDAHRLWRPQALRRHLFLDLQGQVLHRRRLPARRGRLLLDHRPRRRRDQRRRPPHGHGGGRVGAGRPSQSVGGRRGRLSARHQGPGHLLLRDADGRARPGPTRSRPSCAIGCARRSVRSPRRI